MKFATITTLALLSATGAYAAGSHDHSHETGHMAMQKFGMPGSADKVDRSIDVTMRESDDGGMIFEPSSLQLTQGETIRFTISNTGALDHEFVLDTVAGNAKHKEMMAMMEMAHDDPNAVRLEPGQTGEIIWTFSNAGTFEFACLIPGHYESGMHGPVEVAAADTGDIYTKGVVKKIKADKGKVTIIHEELTQLDMPAMTMVFDADAAIIGQLSEGQEIEFAVERINGKLTVTGLK